MSITFLESTHTFSCIFSIIKLKFLSDHFIRNPMIQIFFYVEQPSNEPNPPRPKTTFVLNSLEMSGKNTREMITLSPIAPPGPQFIPTDFESNEPTRPFWFGWQMPFIEPSLNNLNLPPNPINVLELMTVIQ